MNVFISYRRKDAWAASSCYRIYEPLAKRFGKDNVFLDIDSIPPGMDFRSVIKNQVSIADIVLVMIGEVWLQMLQERAALPDDFVRLEIEAAMEAQIPLLPILIGHNVHMPRVVDLPQNIAQLAYCNATILDPGKDFSHHVSRLINAIEENKAAKQRDKLRGTHISRPKIFVHDRRTIDLYEAKAKAGDPEAQFAFAEYIRDVCATHMEWCESLEYYEKAAKQGFIPAMYHLAYELENGCPGYVGLSPENIEKTKDFKAAAIWYRKIAEAAHDKKKA